MDAEHGDQRRWLRKVVDHLEADANLHAKYLIPIIRNMCKKRAATTAPVLATACLKLGRKSAATGKSFRSPGKDGANAAECKAKDVLFQVPAPFREKAIANWSESAHGNAMHHFSAVCERQPT
jgi:hypothetical protein